MLCFFEIININLANIMPKAQKKWVKIVWLLVAIMTILSMVLWTVQL